jgi:hypothetical protein
MDGAVEFPAKFHSFAQSTLVLTYRPSSAACGDMYTMFTEDGRTLTAALARVVRIIDYAVTGRPHAMSDADVLRVIGPLK